MQSDDTRRRPVRRVMSYLISTGPAGDGSWRWRFATVLAFVGPGSVPFALLLFPPHAAMLYGSYLADWGIVSAAFAGAAIVLARFKPVWAWVLAMAAYVMIVFDSTEVRGGDLWPVTTPLLFTLLVVQFAVARDKRVWVSSLVWLGTLAGGLWAHWMFEQGLLGVRVVNSYEWFDFNPAADSVTITSIFTALILLLGLLVRVWRQGRARVAEKEQIAEAERTRRRILEERARIARELHDVVAHHMSVISVQASTAEYRLADLESGARDEFRSIAAQARESLAEMRRLLAVLRAEDEAGPRTPQPGPDRLESLAESAERAGVPVAFTVAELPEDLPDTVSLTVYRLVQEALSNVVRHAPGASTEVEVRVDGADVVVTVVNAPPSGEAAPAESHGSGLGLVGMRERVTILGGTLETGPTAAGGFEVRARLPLGAKE